MSGLHQSAYEKQLENLTLGMSIASLVAVVWLFFFLVYKLKQFRHMPHSQTVVLLVFLVLDNIGRILSINYNDYSLSNNWYKYALYFAQSAGYYGSRINAAFVGLSLYFVMHCDAQLILKYTSCLTIAGFVIPLLLTASIMGIEQEHILNKTNAYANAGNFDCEEEPIVALSVLVLCLFITLVSLIKTYRCWKVVSCHLHQSYQILKHMVMLTYLTAAMFIGELCVTSHQIYELKVSN